MDNGQDLIRGFDELARESAAPTPARGPGRLPRDATGALSLAATDSFSMDKVSRFFDGVVEPRGNALVSEMTDENGPLAGRETARARRRPGSLDHQFGDDDRSLLFAPNDAPDQLPQQPTELDRLLRRQEFRERRRFTA